jgi:ABC-type molybdate transport system substrate-binding protein
VLRFIGVFLAVITVGCVGNHNSSEDQLQVNYAGSLSLLTRGN